ncbi:hypothetical protein E4U59_007670 [Claviceps monticola]|nr:hypothetical protein E4U59_007670 [Claviceps monticola]
MEQELLSAHCSLLRQREGDNTYLEAILCLYEPVAVASGLGTQSDSPQKYQRAG